MTELNKKVLNGILSPQNTPEGSGYGKTAVQHFPKQMKEPGPFLKHVKNKEIEQFKKKGLHTTRPA